MASVPVLGGIPKCFCGFKLFFSMLNLVYMNLFFSVYAWCSCHTCCFSWQQLLCSLNPSKYFSKRAKHAHSMQLAMVVWHTALMFRPLLATSKIYKPLLAEKNSFHACSWCVSTMEGFSCDILSLAQKGKNPWMLQLCCTAFLTMLHEENSLAWYSSMVQMLLTSFCTTCWNAFCLHVSIVPSHGNNVFGQLGKLANWANF